MMLVEQALQRSTLEELEQPGFALLKAKDSSFDSAALMGHKDPYGLYGPAMCLFSQRNRQNEIAVVDNAAW